MNEISTITACFYLIVRFLLFKFKFDLKNKFLVINFRIEFNLYQIETIRNLYI